MFFLAQTQTASANDFLHQLHAFVPFDAIVKILSDVMPAFFFTAAFCWVIGYVMSLAQDETGQKTTGVGVLIFIAMAASPWLISIVQSVVTGLVNAIGNAN